MLTVMIKVISIIFYYTKIPLLKVIIYTKYFFSFPDCFLSVFCSLKKAPLFLLHDSLMCFNFFTWNFFFPNFRDQKMHTIKKNQTCNSNWVATAIVFLFPYSNHHSSRCQMLMYYTVIDKGDSSRLFFKFYLFIKKKLKVVSIFFSSRQLFFFFSFL